MNTFLVMICFKNETCYNQFRKNKMKKRNIIIISLSTISLIFGGLVFLGVSTFPELLEEEKKEIEHSHEEVLFNAPSNDNKKDDQATVVVASDKASNYIVEGSKNTKSSPHFSTKGTFEFIHYSEERVSLTVKETPSINKEVATSSSSEVKAPSTYYKGKSYVSIKREREAKNIVVKEKLDRSEVIENRNKNIVNTIILVVVAIEALAFIILNKKRHSHKSQMPNR